MATEPLKAVFDTVVYLQAALNPAGPAFAALELADAGRIRLVASEETLEEVAEVLSRPRLRAKYPDLTDGRTEGPAPGRDPSRCRSSARCAAHRDLGARPGRRALVATPAYRSGHLNRSPGPAPDRRGRSSGR